MNREIYQGAFEKYMHPDYYQLDNNLFLAQFTVMKTLPANNIVACGITENKINKDTHIVDSSSGTFALGLAMTCHHHGLPVTIVGDPAMDEALIQRLEDLYANIIITDAKNGSGNHQLERLKIVQNLLKDRPNTFWCRQYDNPNNMGAYRGFADQLLSLFGDDLILVGTVGSGGSTSGTITYLREKNPNIRMVVVDTFGSVLFGLPESKRELRGLGNSLQPKNLKHELYDEIHWVAAGPAYAATRELHRQHAVFSGITTGAAYLVAKAIAAEAEPNKKVIFIGPDDGVRYANTVYSDEWLASQGYKALHAPRDFSSIHSLGPASVIQGPWVQMDWGRKTLADFLGAMK